jgi:trimethylamine--corrinoid protein Co-methyltransferase
LGLLFPLLNGANIVHDIGFMDAGLQGSLQLMAIADDMLGWIRAATMGVKVTEETLALEIIEELGPEGDYLSHDHTYRHFKDAYYSKLADRQIYSSWEADGSTTMADRAARKVDDILENHKPEPLPDATIKALRDYVEKAKAAVSSNS